MLVLRRILFWIFVAAYVVVCPLTVLYAFGYLMAPGRPTALIKTGVMAVDSNPAGAAIIVDGVFTGQVTPSVVRDVLPGSHDVEVLLEGYEAWTQVMTVEAERATLLDQLVLAPHQFQVQVVQHGPFERLIDVPETPWLLLAHGPHLEDLVLYDLAAERSTRPFLGHADRNASPQVRTWTVVPQSQFVFLETKSSAGTEYLGFLLDPDDVQVMNLTRFFPEPPDQVAWTGKKPRHLLVRHGVSLDRLDLHTLAIEPRVASGVRGSGVGRGHAYVLQRDFTVTRMDEDGTQPEPLFDDPVIGRAMFGEQGRYAIHSVSPELLVFLGKRGEFVMSRAPYRVLDRGVRGLAYDESRKRLLIWRKEDLGFIATHPEDTLLGPFEPPRRLAWIRRGRDLRRAWWMAEGAHVLFQDGDTVRWLEMEHPGRQPVHEVVRVRGGTEAAYREDAGRLYYLDHATGALCRLQIVPERDHGPLREWLDAARLGQGLN